MDIKNVFIDTEKEIHVLGQCNQRMIRKGLALTDTL